jgi:hypothetical protein
MANSGHTIEQNSQFIHDPSLPGTTSGYRYPLEFAKDDSRKTSWGQNWIQKLHSLHRLGMM